MDVRKGAVLEGKATYEAAEYICVLDVYVIDAS